MAQADESSDYVIFGDDNQSHLAAQTVYEWLESAESEECIDRILIETLAQIKSWQHRQNPRTPLRHIVLNRNLYNRVIQFTDL
jgi:hypothetical protein